jgi:hypothetical protein
MEYNSEYVYEPKELEYWVLYWILVLQIIMIVSKYQVLNIFYNN